MSIHTRNKQTALAVGLVFLVGLVGVASSSASSNVHPTLADNPNLADSSMIQLNLTEFIGDATNGTATLAFDGESMVLTTSVRHAINDSDPYFFLHNLLQHVPDPNPPPELFVFDVDNKALGENRSVIVASESYFGGMLYGNECPREIRYMRLVAESALLPGAATVATWTVPMETSPLVSCASDAGGGSGSSSSSDKIVKVILDSAASFTHGSANVYGDQLLAIEEAEKLTYQPLGISFLIMEQWKWSSGGPSHTWCAEGDGNSGGQEGALEFETSHWEDIAPHSTAERQFVALLTGRGQFTTGSWEGCAWGSGLNEDDGGYLVVESVFGADPTEDETWETGYILAHEIGHLFTAEHDYATNSTNPAQKCGTFVSSGETVYQTTLMSAAMAGFRSCDAPNFSNGLIDSSKNNMARVIDCRDGVTCGYI